MSIIICDNCNESYEDYFTSCPYCEGYDSDDDEEDNEEDNEWEDNEEYENDDLPEEMNYTITPNNVAYTLSGEMYTFQSTQPNFPLLCNALVNKNLEALIHETNKNKVNLTLLSGKLYTKHGIMTMVTDRGEFDIDARLFDRIYSALESNESADSMVNFIKNLYDNPNIESIDDMYRFLEHNNLPLTDDGYFIAYKIVNANYRDIHTNSIDNSIGQIVTMPYEDVELNRHKTCSSGLHFCSKDYLPQYGGFFGDRLTGHVMILKINPKDVKSIPVDYNNAKGRCCKYEVIGEVPNDNVKQHIDKLEESSIITNIGNFFKSLFGG